MPELIDSLPPIALLFGVAAFLGLVGLLLGSAISSIDYRVGREALEITVWGRAMRRLPINGFIDAEVGVGHGGENWTNTIRPSEIRARGVTLHRRSGLFRRLHLTPADPVAFVERIRAHPRFEARP